MYVRARQFIVVLHMNAARFVYVIHHFILFSVYLNWYRLFVHIERDSRFYAGTVVSCVNTSINKSALDLST